MQLRRHAIRQQHHCQGFARFRRRTQARRNEMKFSELKGRAVVNLEDARKIGTVEDLMVEPESHHIASIKVRIGMFHASQLIPVADVKNVGGDAVTIATGAGTANIASMVESTAGQHMAASQSSSAVN